MAKVFHVATSSISFAGEIEVTADVEDSEWWQWVTDLDMKGGVSREECEGLDGEPAYEMVDVDEVVEGIALILARYIALHPEYQVSRAIVCCGIPP